MAALIPQIERVNFCCLIWFGPVQPLFAACVKLKSSCCFHDEGQPCERKRKNNSQLPTSGFAADVTTALARGGSAVLAESIAETVGQPENEHVEYAQHLRQSVPEPLYAAAHSPEFAYLLRIALVLDRDGSGLERQLSLVREQLGSDRARLVRSYYDDLANTGAEYRLPLLSIAFPALKLRPSQQLSYLVSLARIGI